MATENPTNWMLYSPAAPGSTVDERPVWVKGLCSSTERLGDEGEFILLREVDCGKWQCGWLEGYLQPNCVVGSFFSAGKGVTALMCHGSPDVVAQPSLVNGNTVGAYQVPMLHRVQNREELASLFTWAYRHLRDRGLLGPHGDRGIDDDAT